MAITCDSTTLVNGAYCNFCNLSGSMLYAIKLRLLCAIANGDMSIACDSASLVEAAKCYECQIPYGMMPAIEIYLLCFIAQNGTGAGGGGGITCGTVDPVAAPTGTCAIYYRKDTAKFWYWDGAAWQVFIQ